MFLISFIFTVALAAKPIPQAKLYATDGQIVNVEGSANFAIVGNSRSTVRRVDVAAGRPSVNNDLRNRIIGNMASTSPDAMILLGDNVLSGSAKVWSKTFLTNPALSQQRLIPVVGDFERNGDGDNLTWSKVFPEIGADIGLNRVSTWYSFDVNTNGTIWRMIVLDSDKDGLNSRWNEQINWLQSNLQGKYDNLIVLMHLPVFDLSGRKIAMNPTGVPGDLVELIEDTAPMLKLKAVVTAGGHASQAMLPFKNFGSVYINAGGGGAPADDLRRSGSGLTANYPDDVELITGFDSALLKRLESQNPSATVLDQAHARNEFTGDFSGLLLAKSFPTYGWWNLNLNGKNATFSFHHALLDGTINEIFMLNYTESNGWQSTSTP